MHSAPALGLLAFIPSPSANGFHVGPLFFHFYGLCYVVAVTAAIIITVRRWEAIGGRRELVYDVALWAFPAGVVGGRIYFLITTPSQIPDHWWGPFAIWQGGLGIWGGVALGAVVGIWRVRRGGGNVVRFMEAVAPALLVAQACGRVGNYFNQELFGLPSKLPWALEISAAHRPERYARFATFQPTFLYELIWDLLLAFALVQLGKRKSIKPPGLFALYVAGYSLARIGEEQLRIDYSKYILGLRLNFFVATVLFIAGVVWFVAIQRGWSWRGRAQSHAAATGSSTKQLRELVEPGRPIRAAPGSKVGIPGGERLPVGSNAGGGSG